MQNKKRLAASSQQSAFSLNHHPKAKTGELNADC